MAITFVTAASAASVTGDITLSRTDFSGLADGDVIVFSTGQFGNAVGAHTIVSVAGGATIEDSHLSSAGTDHLSSFAYFVVSDATTDGPWTFNRSSGGITTEKVLTGLVFRGVDNTTPIDASGVHDEHSDGVDVSGTNITTATNGAMVVTGRNFGDPVGNRGIATGAPSGFTTPTGGLAVQDGSGDSASAEVAYKIQTTAGLVTIGSWSGNSGNSTSDGVTRTLALKPDSGGGISPSAVSSGASVGSPTLSVGAVSVSPSSFASSGSIGSATLSAGPVSITPSAISAGGSVGSPGVAVGAASVSPSAIASGASVGSPSLVPGSVSVSPSSFASSGSVGSPTLVAGGSSITPSAISAGASVGSPSLSAGAVDISPSAVASEESVGSPSVSIDAAFINPTAFGAAGAEVTAEGFRVSGIAGNYARVGGIATSGVTLDCDKLVIEYDFGANGPHTEGSGGSWAAPGGMARGGFGIMPYLRNGYQYFRLYATGDGTWSSIDSTIYESVGSEYRFVRFTVEAGAAGSSLRKMEHRGSTGDSWTEDFSDSSVVVTSHYLVNVDVAVGVVPYSNTTNPWTGPVNSMKVWQDDVLSISFDPVTDASPGALSWTSSATGEVWNVTSLTGIGEPTLSPGTAYIAPSAVGSTESVGSPTLTPGSVEITPTAIPSGETVVTPTVTPGASYVIPTSVGSGSAVGAPTLMPGAAFIVPTAISSGSSVSTPANIGTPQPIALLNVEMVGMVSVGLRERVMASLVPRFSARSSTQEGTL